MKNFASLMSEKEPDGEPETLIMLRIPQSSNRTSRGSIIKLQEVPKSNFKRFGGKSNLQEFGNANFKKFGN